jgi:hypothetical protein
MSKHKPMPVLLATIKAESDESREFLDTLIFVLEGMLAVSYLVIPGILVSA